MPFTPISFESSRVKDAARQDIREAREAVLERAEAAHVRRLEQQERARQRGDDQWMLPSVEARLKDEPEQSTSKKSKHKKKKKHKHKKKKHRKKSSSESSSESGDEWVEKPQPKQPSSLKEETVADKSIPERDAWMALPGLIPCVSRNELRHDKRSAKERESEEAKKNILDNPGQSARELNPYWRDGGSGVPEAPERLEVKLASQTVGDQGAGWLRRALQRVHEQAIETGRSADEIAAERWGSLEKLENLLAEAENRQRPSRDSRRPDHSRSYGDSRRPTDRSRGSDEKPRFARPADDYEDSKDRGHRSSDGRSSSYESHTQSRQRRDDSRDSRSKNDSDSRRREFMRPSEDSAGSVQARPASSRPSGSRNWQKVEARPERKSPPKRSPPKRARSSSSSSSSSSQEEEAAPEQTKLLSDKEMNEIGAKIVKAEILGNEALATSLKQQLETARQARVAAKAAGPSKSKQEDEVVILTRTDARGVTRPLEAPEHQEPSGGRRRKQKVQTHNKEGERERYFPDDDKYRLQDMFTQEKLNSVEDSNYEFAKLIGKGAARMESGEGSLDDMFEERARFKEADGKVQRREREQAVREHQRVSRALEGCRWCVDSKQMLKHLIVALGTKVYLSVPPYRSLTPGHCLLAPTLHTPCATQLDEDVWTEMQTFRKALTRMFAAHDQDVIFFETARNLRGFPHMLLECVPLDRESGNLAPIYFKKAIQECETEWSTNKKLVELAGKGVRRAIPKGLPYFAIAFGDDEGFGHVIEDETQFPHNFAQEVVGGILDLDHQIWRKKHNENFEAQRKKVLELAKLWAPFDFTQKRKESSSSSDSD